MTFEVKVQGLRELKRNLRKIEGAPVIKEFGREVKDIGQEVVRDANPKIPVRSGRARRALRSTAAGKVIFGTKAVPYAGWLDFGGRVGRNRSVSRPVVKGGRYVYASFGRRKPVIVLRLVALLDRMTKRAGLR